MKACEFGKENKRKIVLIPGNMMCWKQFAPVIPILAKDFHVIAISTDGYDGTTTFTTAASSAKKLPWMLKLFTRTDDEKLLCQFHALAPNISLETLKNCTAEAFRLYGELETQEPEPNAKVAIWYGGKEPNMKKAVEKITRAYPNAEDHPFSGFGHREIMTRPELIAEEISRFLD